MGWRRHLILPVLLALVLAAVAATAGLGNPLGRAIGSVQFAYRVESGSVRVESALPADHSELATWSDAWVRAVAAWAGTAPPPLIVRLLADRGAYVQHGRQSIPGFDPSRDWCYDPSTGAVYGWAARPEEMRRHLRRESFRLIMAARAKTSPAWLIEGTGSLLEGAELADGRLVVAGLKRDRLRQAARLLASGRQPSLLVQADRLRPGAERQEWQCLAYAAAAVLGADGRLHGAIREGADPPARLQDFAANSATWATACRTLAPAPDGG